VFAQLPQDLRSEGILKDIDSPTELAASILIVAVQLGLEFAGELVADDPLPGPDWSRPADGCIRFLTLFMQVGWAQSHTARWRLSALARLRAAALPLRSINMADERFARSRSAPVMLAPVRSAPARSAP
jgi:hypothetical protein